MITAQIDTKALGRQIAAVARAFGEENEAAISRWGTATGRRLVIETQVFGDGKDAYEKQKKAILKDANRVIGVVKSAREAKLVNAGFTRNRKILKTPEQVNEWIENLRRGKKRRTVKIERKYKAVTTERVFNAAMKQRFRNIWKGKGGWIGAAIEISRFQKGPGRIVIGKNFAARAHKWKKGGDSRMRRSRWNPEGTMNNRYQHVSHDYVLNRNKIQKAVNDGGKNTLKYYEKRMEARLRKINKP